MGLQESPHIGSVWMNDCSVNLYSTHTHFVANLQSFSDYRSPFPGWQFSNQPAQSSYGIEYLKQENHGIHYDSLSKRATVFGPLGDVSDGQALAYMGFWMMEAQRQNNSTFTMHSSAMVLEGKGMLILGHSGSGKTSLMLDLCQKFDSEIVSNDLTYVQHCPDGRMNLVDGTKSINLRLASVEANSPQLRGLFKDSASSTWHNKITVSPEDVGAKTTVGSRTLNAIIEIHLDGKKMDPLKVVRSSGREIKYRLYEDMARIIRGSAISIFGGKR